MSSAAELKVNRFNTAAFIAANSTIISLIPQAKTRTPSGGFEIVQAAARIPQRFRLIDDVSSSHQPAQRTIDGVEHSTQYVLLGKHDALLGLYDTWTDSEGLCWEITKILPANGYEQRALVVRYGK